MGMVWNSLISLEQYIKDSLDKISYRSFESTYQSNFDNLVWTNESFRRAHICVVNAIETKGLWMFHCCIFPHLHNPAPIFGFDVVAGKNKITGCFHDFSPTCDKNHFLIDWFRDNVKHYNWNKKRELPEWAKRIFTEDIIAAGNVQDENELLQMQSMIRNNLDYYLLHVDKTNNQVISTKTEQNFYSINQKLNPHTPRVMTSLGLDKNNVTSFINEYLFPEI
jgi:phycocyanobilin:ferredoxin oxidoreductase